MAPMHPTERLLGPARDRLRVPSATFDRAQLKRLQDAGVLVLDERRTRPVFFDGRFLAAKDLIREQAYVLSRQADLARAAGVGVVDGLMVKLVDQQPRRVRIEAGFGLTDAGEQVVLVSDVEVSLGDLAEVQRLDERFGLSRTPNDPARSLSGLHILALRPVEYTANPIASYPTSLTGSRTVEDGDIVEATAVVLIPYRSGTDVAGMARSRAAYDLFIQEGGAGLSPNLLPLAILALDGNAVQWIDPFLVRREVGSDHGGIRGLGFARKDLREAHITQYDQQLLDVLRDRKTRGLGPRFAASEHFLALPPAGRLPAAAIETGSFMQAFFPPDVDVELAIVPDDEVAALLEESLLLPPFDLTLPGEALESSAALILIPTPRWQVQRLSIDLPSIVRPMRPAAPGLIAKRRPFEALLAIPPILAVAPPPAVNDADARWRSALANLKPDDLLWYVRRRQLSVKEELFGVDLLLFTNVEGVQASLTPRLEGLATAEVIQAVMDRATAAQTLPEVVSFLGSFAFDDAPILLSGGLRALAQAPDPLGRDAVMAVWGSFGGAHFGEGIARLQEANDQLRTPEVAIIVAASDRVPELDYLGRTATPEEAKRLADLIVGKATEDVADPSANVAAEIDAWTTT